VVLISSSTFPPVFVSLKWSCMRWSSQGCLPKSRFQDKLSVESFRNYTHLEDLIAEVSNFCCCLVPSCRCEKKKRHQLKALQYELFEGLVTISKNMANFNWKILIKSFNAWSFEWDQNNYKNLHVSTLCVTPRKSRDCLSAKLSQFE
jgi:hypothetical protein